MQLDRAEKNHSQTEEQLANLRQTHSLYKNKVRDVLFFSREKEAVFFYFLAKSRHISVFCVFSCQNAVWAKKGKMRTENQMEIGSDCLE